NPFTISGQASVNLSAPTLGTYQGISLFQTRGSAAPITVFGNSQVNLNGVMYAAAASITVTGNGNLKSDLIAFDLQVSGNGRITTMGTPSVVVVDASGTFN